MKISFSNQDISNYESKNIPQAQDRTGHGEKAVRNNSSVMIDFGSGINGLRSDLLPGSGERIKGGKSLTELQLEAGAVDNGVAQDYRTVLSNTMSAEDYAKAQEEGFDYNTMDPDEVVTIQDRIKAEVAKSGEVIVGYNNDLKGEVLAKALGSETLARSISESLSNSDIPLTNENIEDIKAAWDLVNNLEDPSDEDIAYIIKNELEPDVWSLYLAESSGTAATADVVRDVVKLEDPENAKLKTQVENIIRAGKDISDDVFKEKMKTAQWLLDKGLPVSDENIEKYGILSSEKIPKDEESFAGVVANAIDEGKNPINASLKERESIIEKAINLEMYYFSEEIYDKNSADSIISRRQLEEIRLSMTAEVNIKLLKSDYAIDTAPMEEFIEALKEAEKQVAAKYFPDIRDSEDKAVESYRLMKDTVRSVDEIKAIPAANLGLFTFRSAEDIDLGEFHRSGLALRDTYVKAGESYEALMTAPRADLGDNIRKAFSNAESLAKELGINTDEQSLRAIRILGYNNSPISAESVEIISNADMKVRGVIEKMNPAAVLNMIRDGINPLEKNFDELNLYFEGKDSEQQNTDAKSYSEFLYGLERQDNITPEERESYIGIYRLIHQIEKDDGAVIGAVIGEQAKLSFENLLSAARTKRLKGVDVRIDEEFGGRTDIIKTAASITDQIGKAFEAERLYAEAEDLRETASVSRESAQLLDDNGIPKSADNLRSAEHLLNSGSNLYEDIIREEKKLSDKNRTTVDGQKSPLSMIKSISGRLIEDLSEDDFDREYEDAADSVKEIAEELELRAESYLDVKAMSLAGKQLGLMTRVSNSSNTSDRDYIIPMEMGGEMSKVHISLRSVGEDANMSIRVFGGDTEIEGHFGISNGIFEGYIVKNGDSELKKLQSLADIFDESLVRDGDFKDVSPVKTPVISRDSQKGGHPLSNRANRSKDAKESNSDGSERRILLCAAKVFLSTAGEIFRD